MNLIGVGPIGGVGAGAPPVFGSHYQSFAQSGPVGDNGATPVLFATFVTSTVPSGNYYMEINSVLQGTLQGDVIQASLEIDGLPAGVPYLSASTTPGGTKLVDPHFDLVWAAGTHEIKFYFARPSGPGGGAVTALFARATLWRAK